MTTPTDPLAADRARTAGLDTMDLVAVLDLASAMTRERVAAAPGVAVYDLVDDQIAFMQAVLHLGAAPSEADRERVTLGAVAVRNFDDVDPEYARVLATAAHRFRSLPEAGA